MPDDQSTAYKGRYQPRPVAGPSGSAARSGRPRLLYVYVQCTCNTRDLYEMATSNPVTKMTREDWRKQKELKEARKAGTAPAEVDEEGK